MGNGITGLLKICYFFVVHQIKVHFKILLSVRFPFHFDKILPYESVDTNSQTLCEFWRWRVAKFIFSEQQSINFWLNWCPNAT